MYLLRKTNVLMLCLSLLALVQFGCDTHTAIDEETLPIDRLVAAYPFNGNADDVSGNNHHATIGGATLTADRFGTPNSAYTFDGVDDYIDTFTSFDYPNRSILLWIKANVISGQQLNHHKIFVQDANTLTHGGWTTFLDGGALFLTDGVKVAENTPDRNLGSSSDAYENLVFGAGRCRCRRFFDGNIDDVYIFDCALTEADVQLFFTYQP